MARRMNIAIFLDEKPSARGGVWLVGTSLCKLLHSHGHDVTLLNSHQLGNPYSSSSLIDDCEANLTPEFNRDMYEDLVSSDAVLFLSTRHQIPDYLRRVTSGKQSGVRWTVQGVNCLIIGQSGLNLQVAKMIWTMIRQLDVCGMSYSFRPLYQELRDVKESATPSI